MKVHSGSDSLLAVINTLGHGVLIETMRAAVFYITHSNQSSSSYPDFFTDLKEGKSCYYFIQGTGLQTVIERFGLDYDADILLDSFNYHIRHT